MNILLPGIRLVLFQLAIGFLVNLGMCNSNIVLAKDFIIDDRVSGNLSSNLGTQWRMITDQVMGGVSIGDLTVDAYKSRHCLCMRGNVSTDNNGGFVQMALDLSSGESFDASDYDGIELSVSGNNERYNIHLRTTDLWLPWQSYRFSFKVTPAWQIIRIPFENIAPYRTTAEFRKDKLKRIGLVGIGRDFEADLCVASVKFYAAE